jgi:hypothetical protein
MVIVEPVRPRQLASYDENEGVCRMNGIMRFNDMEAKLQTAIHGGFLQVAWDCDSHLWEVASEVAPEYCHAHEWYAHDHGTDGFDGIYRLWDGHGESESRRKTSIKKIESRLDHLRRTVVEGSREERGDNAAPGTLTEKEKATIEMLEAKLAEKEKQLSESAAVVRDLVQEAKKMPRWSLRMRCDSDELSDSDMDIPTIVAV